MVDIRDRFIAVAPPDDLGSPGWSEILGQFTAAAPA
jgi:hypothetical protein